MFISDNMFLTTVNCDVQLQSSPKSSAADVILRLYASLPGIRAKVREDKWSICSGSGKLCSNFTALLDFCRHESNCGRLANWSENVQLVRGCTVKVLHHPIDTFGLHRIHSVLTEGHPPPDLRVKELNIEGLGRYQARN